MAGAEGFEPPTIGFGDRCSTNWNYAPVVFLKHVIQHVSQILLIPRLSKPNKFLKGNTMKGSALYSPNKFNQAFYIPCIFNFATLNLKNRPFGVPIILRKYLFAPKVQHANLTRQFYPRLRQLNDPFLQWLINDVLWPVPFYLP